MAAEQLSWTIYKLYYGLYGASHSQNRAKKPEILSEHLIARFKISTKFLTLVFLMEVKQFPRRRLESMLSSDGVMITKKKQKQKNFPQIQNINEGLNKCKSEKALAITLYIHLLILRYKI